MSDATTAERRKEGGGVATRTRRFLRWAFPVLLILPASPAVAADLTQYRSFTLGASVADVVAGAGIPERDVKTLHARPALLQEASWRPPYASTPANPGGDSVRGIVFSFIDDQLFRIAIEYDQSRTTGLTNDDMLGSLAAIYGPPSRLPVPAIPRAESFGAPTTIAWWREGDNTVVLGTTPYSGSFGLTITSTSREALARKARAAAVTMDTREEPAREAARARQQAEAERAAAEKARINNKAVFKP